MLFVSLAGRIAVAQQDEIDPPAPAGTPRVVVAVIDSGINPYHEFFNRGGEPYRNASPSAVTPDVLAAFGIDAAHQIELTRTGNFAADYAADLPRVWNNIRPGELYWFKGTNIIAVSFAAGTRPILPDTADDTHGVGTAAAVVRANPEAIVLFVEGINDEAERFAFTHPEVDIITTSYGFPGSLPLPGHLNQSFTGVVNMGKLHFGAADNSPALSPPDGTSGPWWSIGVAGFQEAGGTNDPGSGGRQLVSGTLPDFVADFSQYLPYCYDCESGGMSFVSGTSFATPRSAGTTSKILLEARRALGHAGGIRFVGPNREAQMVVGADRAYSNWQLRRALESAAYFPRVVDYTLTTSGTFNLTSVPVLDPVPWATVGWGVITPDPTRQVVEQTLAHLGIRGSVTRQKDDAACAFMSAQITARHAYWDFVALESESNGFGMSGQDPYIYCGQ
jgi:hypothetical protein